MKRFKAKDRAEIFGDRLRLKITLEDSCPQPKPLKDADLYQIQTQLR